MSKKQAKSQEERFNYQPPAIELTDSWPNILWREKRFCQDAAYAEQIEGLLAGASIGWGLTFQGRPMATEVELALWQACQALSLPIAHNSWPGHLQLLAEKRQKPDTVANLLADLDHSDWLKRFVARHVLVTWGGEAIPALLETAGIGPEPLGSITAWLVNSIQFETTARIFPNLGRFLCLRCLVRCRAHWVERIDRIWVGYYGCRACGQSRDLITWTGPIVTVLDRSLPERYRVRENVLQGNWLVTRSLFDCHWVEIIEASDEEIEYFAVQVGNDTDELRQPYYKQMRCLLGPACRPSDNTVRILKRIFGRVEQIPARLERIEQ